MVVGTVHIINILFDRLLLAAWGCDDKGGNEEEEEKQRKANKKKKLEYIKMQRKGARGT